MQLYLNWKEAFLCRIIFFIYTILFNKEASASIFLLCRNTLFVITNVNTENYLNITGLVFILRCILQTSGLLGDISCSRIGSL